MAGLAMTRDDIIRMAREECPYTSDEMRGAFYEGFLKGAAAERQACAKLCDVTPPYPFRPSIEAAHAIRARGQE